MKRVAAVLMGILGCCVGALAADADLILVHGKVLTMDARDSIVQAVAIRGGKIVLAGSDADVAKLAGNNTKTVDLHGRTATPGLIDTHGHYATGGVIELYQVQLSDAAKIADVVAAVQTKVATLRPGEWLLGSGWDEGKLAEQRYVLASDLDAVSPQNPVWLMHTTGHYGVANSYALRLAEIDNETKNPTAGTIDRDPTGRATGVLKEAAAMSLLTRLIPPVTPEHERNGIAHMIEALHREGMTAIKDPDIDVHTWEAYRALLDEGKLQEHVCVLWHGGTTLASAKEALGHVMAQPRVPQSLGDGRLLSCGVKLYMDGSGGARTAWLYADWNKKRADIDVGNRGYPLIDPQVYREQVRLLHAAGVNVGTHAIGDHAIDWVVDTYAQVLDEKPVKGLRHTVIHANIPSAHAIEQMARLEKQYDAAYPESQPPFVWWIGDTYAGNFGTERSLRLNPYQTYARSGVAWAGGSDYPVTPFPARYGIWSAIERKTLKGVYGTQPFGVAEAIDVHAALRAYTSGAARELFLENRIGSLEVGKDADIAVWDRDLYSVPTPALRDMQCEMTLLGGNIVYDLITSRK